jgi:hypothetical protein
MDSFIVLSGNHDNIGALERGSDHGSAAGGGELNVAGQQGIDTARCAATDKDRFGFDAVFLEKAALLGHPDRAVGRAERAHADPDLVESPYVSRASAAEGRYQKSPVKPSPAFLHVAINL